MCSMANSMVFKNVSNLYVEYLWNHMRMLCGTLEGGLKGGCCGVSNSKCFKVLERLSVGS